MPVAPDADAYPAKPALCALIQGHWKMSRVKNWSRPPATVHVPQRVPALAPEYADAGNVAGTIPPASSYLPARYR
ncbi:hypothetical protein D3C87_1712930 [compost metagenome]